MAKDPAFLFYPGDWLGGTMGMTFEQKGAYIDLLMLQFNRGHMTKDMIGQTVGQLWDIIKDKFVQDDKGLWFNERLDLEKFKRKKYTESRRNNKKGTNQHSIDGGHMSSHMEDKDINEDKSIDIINKDKNRTLAARIEKFAEKVNGLNNEDFILLPKELIKFLDYWTEHGEKDKKARWEKEKVFDFKKRLVRWANSNKQDNNGQDTDSFQETYEALGGGSL